MKRIINLILISAMTVIAVSCGGKIDLNGEWKITSVGSDAIEESEAVPTLSFNTSTGRIHCYTGVNIVNGDFTQEGRRLTLSCLGATRMAGPAEDMQIERNILDGFEKVYSSKMSDDGTLHLLDKEGETVMILQKRQ